MLTPLRLVLTASRFGTTSPIVTTDLIVFSHLLAELALRQLPCGGWATRASSSQAAIEPTCYSALVLDSAPMSHAGRAQEFLLRSQNPNGSWPAFAGDDQDGAWVTSLALISLADQPAAVSARLKGFEWLMNSAGQESNWFWNWKFRTADRQVRFDPDKFGWPWFPGTVSWVVPTAFALLALNQRSCSCNRLEGFPSRVQLGVEMLLDRACPDGGWNAGNSVVYGSGMAPHPDDTATALLVLSDRRQHPVVKSSIRYLEHVAPTLTAPWSLAWTILALAAYGRQINSLRRSLVAIPDLLTIADTSTLALVCLALDHQRTLSALGVMS